MSEDDQQEINEKTTNCQVAEPTNCYEVGLSRDALLAELAMSAGLTGAAVAVEFSKHTVGELNLRECVSVLNAKVAAVHGGDLREVEAILTAQALALNAIFAQLAVYSGLNVQHSLAVADRLLRLALRAQAQCRATLETLAALKNPPAAVFARQANIAHGPQQVNNGIAAGPTGNPQLAPNELLEHQDGERLDAGAAGAAGASGAAMATVGARDWPTHR